MPDKPIIAHVSSIGQCGISEHTLQLVAHCDGFEHHVSDAWLDPAKAIGDWDHHLNPSVVHLNYHRGLHSRWTPEVVAALEYPVVITFHDTYEQQPDKLPFELLACPNVKAVVVHEFTTDLIARGEDLTGVQRVHYLPQPCPPDHGWLADLPMDHLGRPYLGTVGFDFPWKNYDNLAEITASVGWGLRIAGRVTPERQDALLKLNPYTHFDGYVTVDQAIGALRSCHATAFMYTCANSGTSGAIRLGIAAGKTVYAQEGCRQFRDLATATPQLPFPFPAIEWTTLDGLATDLLVPTQVGGINPRIVHLRTLLSWEKRGQDYAKLFWKAYGIAYAGESK